jgi:hypothetical protein
LVDLLFNKVFVSEEPVQKKRKIDSSSDVVRVVPSCDGPIFSGFVQLAKQLHGAIPLDASSFDLNSWESVLAAFQSFGDFYLANKSASSTFSDDETSEDVDLSLSEQWKAMNDMVQRWSKRKKDQKHRQKERFESNRRREHALQTELSQVKKELEALKQSQKPS